MPTFLALLSCHSLSLLLSLLLSLGALLVLNPPEPEGIPNLAMPLLLVFPLLRRQ
jgi:hypothetical protein